MFIKVINMKIGIIGGSDGLGKTLVYYFRDEFDVTITARDHQKGRKVAVWTGKSKEEYEKVKEMIDICIFENEETTK